MPSWTGSFPNSQFYLSEDLPFVASFEPKPHVDRDDNACLLFTSGSTGKPKGVMLSHGNILAYVEHSIERYQLTKFDRVTQMTELTFDFAVQDMFMSWAVGACVYAFPEDYFIGLPRYLNNNKITFMTTVPSTARLLNKLGKLEKNSLPYLRQNIFGGEPFSDSIATLWQEAAPNTKIDNVCGPTEATIAYMAYPWDLETAQRKGPRNCIPLGQVLPGESILIVDEKLKPVAEGNLGELLLSGPQVIKAYWRNAELSKTRFVKAVDKQGVEKTWYRTGDIVLWDNEDGVVFKGRVDDQIQIRGCRVEKLEIERVVREAAASEFVAVLPWPIAADGTVQGVVAFVSNSTATANEIYKACRKLLPDYMAPKQVYLVDSLPLNFNGKTDYLALKKICQEQNTVVSVK
jgi:acyl-coenzyme A synthetase/AMP-(fatty) acid ligase